MDKNNPGRNLLLMLTAIATVGVFSQGSFAAGMGCYISNTRAEWQWGSEYIPSGTTPVRCTWEFFGDGIVGMDMISPFYREGEWVGREGLQAQLVEVNGNPVQYAMNEYPRLSGTEMSVTWEISPAPGYQWQKDTFYLEAGASAVLDDMGGGAGAIPAVGGWFKLLNPYTHFSSLRNDFDQFTHKQELGDRRAGWEAWTFPGRGPTNAVPSYYNLTPGVWVKKGDKVVFNADGTFEVGAFGSPIYLDGDGTDEYESYRYLSDVPTGALIAGVFPEMAHESVVLFSSEGNPDGFIGAGQNEFIAPETGLLAFRVNLLTYDEGARGIKLDSDYTIGIMLPEPTTISMFGIGGWALLFRKRRQK